MDFFLRGTGVLRGFGFSTVRIFFCFFSLSLNLTSQIRPKSPDYITLDDILRAPMGGTAISILTDAQAFFNYDNRENLMQSPEEEDEE